MWHAPDDPQIFGQLDIDARPLIELIERERRAGHRITPTHLVGRAVAHTLTQVPELNVRIRGGWAHPRPSVDVFFITAVESGHDLSGVKIEDVAGKSAVHVAQELAERVLMLKAGCDRDFRRTKRLMDTLPPWLLRGVLRATAFLTERHQLDVRMLSLRRSPFGSAMVSSVGMFGLPQGFAPLAWMYDVPLLVLVGEIEQRPVVENGRVVVRDILPITATIDHRYVDGWHVSHAMKAFRAYLANPAAFEGGVNAFAPVPAPVREARHVE